MNIVRAEGSMGGRSGAKAGGSTVFSLLRSIHKKGSGSPKTTLGAVDGAFGTLVPLL